MPTVYHSDNAGLPAFTISTTSSLARFINFKLLFKACLVTGYGSRPAAGWALIDEADTYLVLRNASGKYVSLVCTFAYNSATTDAYMGFRIYLSATYTGMVSGVPQGLGVVSGTASGNSSPHYWGSRYFYWYAISTKWLVIADSKTFIFVSIGSSNNSITGYSGMDLDNNANVGPSTLYVGDDLAGNFVAAGGIISSTVPTQHISMQFTEATFTTLYNPKTGLLVDTGGVVATLESIAPAASGSLARTVNTDLPVLELAQVRWVCDGQAQAGLRGVRLEQLLKRCWSYVIKNSLAGTSLPAASINLGNILTPTILPDGYSYVPLLALNSSRQGALITDSPSYW